jgi:hypothetical protein
MGMGSEPFVLCTKRRSSQRVLVAVVDILGDSREWKALVSQLAEVEWFTPRIMRKWYVMLRDAAVRQKIYPTLCCYCTTRLLG